MKYQQDQLSDGLFQRWTMSYGDSKGQDCGFSWVFLQMLWCKKLLSRPTWLLDTMINFSKSLPKKQASILIFMSPCGTLAFFHSHEKPTFNIQWGMADTKNPSWSFFIYWQGTLKNYVPLMKPKEGKQRSSIHTGRGGGGDGGVLPYMG